MAFKRYDGFYAKSLQEKFDNEMASCPFCGENPHWLLDLKSGLIKGTVTCMCEKCGAKLYAESSMSGWSNDMRVVDVGDRNVNGLALDSTYHIESLKSIAAKTPSTAALAAGATKGFPQSEEQGADISSAQITENVIPQTTAAPAPSSASVSKKPWMWAVIGVAAILVTVLIIVFAVRGCSGGDLTYENYMKIENGMTYSQVADILGGEGELSVSSGSGGYTLKYYVWSNSSSTKIITVGFENGRVCAKSQIGLT